MYVIYNKNEQMLKQLVTIYKELLTARDKSVKRTWTYGACIKIKVTGGPS